MMATRIAARYFRNPVISSFKRLKPVSHKFIATSTCLQTGENNIHNVKTSVADYVVCNKDANDMLVEDTDVHNVDNILHDVGAEMNFDSIMMMNSTSDDYVVDSVVDNNNNNNVKSGYEIDDMLLEDVEDIVVEDAEVHDVGGEMNFESIMMNSTTNGDSVEYDEDSDYNQTDDDIRGQILSVALENVPLYGWSTKSIEAAVEALELSPSSSDIFKRGAVDLVMFFVEEGNNALIEHMAKEAKKVNLSSEDERSEFIEKAIKTRLQMIIPYIDTWPQAMNLMASPTATKEIFENGANLLDEILYHAGDFSTDMSWYTKRGVLAAINVATELHMINDSSPDYQDTWAFLHRRMQDAKTLHYAKDSLTNAASDALALASAGMTIAQNILGMGSKRR